MTDQPPTRSRAILVIPIALLLGVPVMVGGWLFFYNQQKTTLAEAASTSTPPARLAKLARSGNLDVKMRVAVNPATPKDALERIAEDPTLRYYLVFKPDAPEAVLRKVVEDEKSKKDALMAAAGHRRAPVDVLDALSGHPYADVRAEVARNPRVRQEILNRLANDDSDAVAAEAKKMLDNRAGSGHSGHDHSGHDHSGHDHSGHDH